MTATDHDRPVDPERVRAARARVIDVEEASRLTGLLGLLADSTRIRILYALDTVGDELCVGDIALALDASEDSVSYALRLLRTSGLVSSRKQAGWSCTGSPRAFPSRCATSACGRWWT